MSRNAAEEGHHDGHKGAVPASSGARRLYRFTLVWGGNRMTMSSSPARPDAKERRRAAWCSIRFAQQTVACAQMTRIKDGANGLVQNPITR